MVDEFSKLFELTVRELRLAAVRIERQSWLILRARIRVRRYCKKYRRWRRRLRKSRKPNEHRPGPACDWEPREFRGRLYWVCPACEQTALRPMTAYEQRRAGHVCRKPKGVASAANRD